MNSFVLNIVIIISLVLVCANVGINLIFITDCVIKKRKGPNKYIILFWTAAEIFLSALVIFDRLV